MKVIIVEVTRAANTFGRTHVDKIMQAYEGIARIVKQAQEEGVFRTDVDALFAAQAFYGLIEQVLTQWIFSGLPVPARGVRARQDRDRRDDLRRPGWLTHGRGVDHLQVDSTAAWPWNQPSQWVVARSSG